jgi:hypothetical protein
LGGLKTLIGEIGLVQEACLILSFLVPLVFWSIRTIMGATTERKMAKLVMMLWKYKPLDQDDAL